MSGTVPPPPPPDGRPDEGTGGADPASTAVSPAAQGQPQRVPSATRMPPAISPSSQFSDAVTPAPAPPVQQPGYAQQQPYAQQPYAQQPTYPQQPYPQQPGYPQPGYPPQGHTGYQGYPPQGYPQRPGYDQQGYPRQEPDGPARRRLSPGWIAFIVLDVILVVAAIVFAVQLMSDDGEPTNIVGSNPDTSASAPVDDGEDAAESPEPTFETGLELDAPGAEVFASPSGNITCTVTAAAATCGIVELESPPAPGDCEGVEGHIVALDEDGTFGLPCVAKKDKPKSGKDLKIMEYDESLAAHGFTCVSRNTGMSCTHDATGSGFTIARAGISQS